MRSRALLTILAAIALGCGRTGGSSPNAEPVHTTIAKLGGQAESLRGRQVVFRCMVGPNPLGPAGALVATDTRVAVVPLQPVRFVTPAVQEGVRARFPSIFEAPVRSGTEGSSGVSFNSASAVPYCARGALEGSYVVIHDLWLASGPNGCVVPKPTPA
jgi:hypothetical protein